MGVASGVRETAPTARFLASALGAAGDGVLGLSEEVERLNAARDLDVSEIVTASVRLRPGRLDRRRYDSALAWSTSDLGGFYESAVNGAPTSCLRELLSARPPHITAWMADTEHVHTYAGVDFDQRRYKLYLFREPGSTLTNGVDLASFAPALHRSAYIDCLELDMDTAAPARSAYCKLGPVDFADVLSPTYRPHPKILNRILRIAGRARVVAALDAIQAGQLRNEPIIKFRRPANSGPSSSAAELAASEYAIECSLFDPERLKYINDYAQEILAIASVLACRDDVAAWLDAVRPFDPYIHYLGVGGDFVTIYYHSCVLRRKKPLRVARG